MLKYTISWKFTKNINTSLPVSITVINIRKYFNDCVQLGPISTFLHQFSISLPPFSRQNNFERTLRNMSSCTVNEQTHHLLKYETKVKPYVLCICDALYRLWSCNNTLHYNLCMFLHFPNPSLDMEIFPQILQEWPMLLAM